MTVSVFLDTGHWIIVRQLKDSDCYWLPSLEQNEYTAAGDGTEFTDKPDHAVRFADKESADIIIDRLLGNVGRAVFIPPTESKAS